MAALEPGAPFPPLALRDARGKQLDPAEGETLYAIWGSGNVFYAVGANGSIVKSSDGGQSWVSQISTTTEVLRGVFGTGTNQTKLSADSWTSYRSATGTGNSWFGETWTANARL